MGRRSGGRGRVHPQGWGWVGSLGWGGVGGWGGWRGLQPGWATSARYVGCRHTVHLKGTPPSRLPNPHPTRECRGSTLLHTAHATGPPCRHHSAHAHHIPAVHRPAAKRRAAPTPRVISAYSTLEALRRAQLHSNPRHAPTSPRYSPSPLTKPMPIPRTGRWAVPPAHIVASRRPAPPTSTRPAASCCTAGCTCSGPACRWRTR